MKNNRPVFRFFIFLMTLTLLTSVFCGTQAEGEVIDAGAMVLTKGAVISDDVSFANGGILMQHETIDGVRKMQILNQNGGAFSDVWYDGVYSIISDGICLVYTTTADGTQLYGIVDSVREAELLPCEAIDVTKLSDRFLLICYMTEAGTEEDYFGSYYSNSNRVYYKGYARILDLEQGQVIPGVEITTTYYDAAAMGNMIFVEGDYPATNVYAADGTFVGCYEYLNPYSDSNLAVQSVDEGICIYDADMNMVSLLETDSYYDYQPIDGVSTMLEHRVVNDENEYMYCVTDLEGNVLSGAYSLIISVSEQGHMSIYDRETGLGALVALDGTVLIANAASLTYYDPGYYVAEIMGEGYYLYDLNGKKINETAFADHDGLVFYNENMCAVACETGEEIAAGGYAYELYGTLVLVDSTVYDALTGKAVLSNVDDYVVTGSSLYVWDSETETCTRYIAQFKPVE